MSRDTDAPATDGDTLIRTGVGCIGAAAIEGAIEVVCMAGSLVRTVVIMAAWGTCLSGAIAIANWQGDLEHAICGPWGCGPRLPPLISCHAVWLVILALPAGFVASSRHVSPAARRVIGGTLTGVAGALFAGFLAWHLLTWWPQAAAWQRPYFWHRYAFTVATAIDVPAAELLVLGVAIWIAGHVTGRRCPDDHEARASAGGGGDEARRNGEV